MFFDWTTPRKDDHLRHQRSSIDPDAAILAARLSTGWRKGKNGSDDVGWPSGQRRTYSRTLMNVEADDRWVGSMCIGFWDGYTGLKLKGTCTDIVKTWAVLTVFLFPSSL